MRRFLAVAVFVVACFALMATSLEKDDDFGREQYRMEGDIGAPSFALTEDSPKRAFLLAVQVQPSEKVLSFGGTLEISATASWEPSGQGQPDGGASPADGDEEDAGEGGAKGPPIQLTVLEEGSDDVQGVAYEDALQFDHSSDLDWDCKEEETCEQTFRITFERTDDGKQGGAQRVNWAIAAELTVKTTIRKGEDGEEEDEDAGSEERPRLRMSLEVL